MARSRPHCLRVITVIALLMLEALKSTIGQNLTVLISHDVDWILNSKDQSDSGSTFKAAVTQVVSKAQGIEYHLHCSWRTQWSMNSKSYLESAAATLFQFPSFKAQIRVTSSGNWAEAPGGKGLASMVSWLDLTVYLSLFFPSKTKLLSSVYQISSGLVRSFSNNPSQGFA